MATAKPKGKLTYADYAATPDDERWELIDGVLYRMAPAPNTNHQRALLRLVSAFVLHFSRVGQPGELFFAPTDLILSDGTTVQPDMLFVSEDRRGIIALRGCEGPPDLVVEVLSPSNTAHDLETKRELYARFGIPEYLILDSAAETVLALSEPAIWRRSLYDGNAVPLRRCVHHRRRPRTNDCSGRYFRLAVVIPARVVAVGAGFTPAPVEFAYAMLLALCRSRHRPRQHRC